MHARKLKQILTLKKDVRFEVIGEGGERGNHQSPERSRRQQIRGCRAAGYRAEHPLSETAPAWTRHGRGFDLIPPAAESGISSCRSLNT
jgi:hypothetical protein